MGLSSNPAAYKRFRSHKNGVSRVVHSVVPGRYGGRITSTQFGQLSDSILKIKPQIKSAPIVTIPALANAINEKKAAGDNFHDGAQS